MIGRNNPDSAAILGAQPPHRNSPGLAQMALAANARVSQLRSRLARGTPEPPEGWYFRSDHLPYARAGIPAHLLQHLAPSGLSHPADKPPTINAKLARMTSWMYATGWLRRTPTSAGGGSGVQARALPGFHRELLRRVRRVGRRTSLVQARLRAARPLGAETHERPSLLLPPLPLESGGQMTRRVSMAMLYSAIVIASSVLVAQQRLAYDGVTLNEEGVPHTSTSLDLRDRSRPPACRARR